MLTLPSLEGFNFMRKILAVTIFLFIFCGHSNALELPDNFGQWKKVSENILPLVTDYNQESHGRFVFVTYKSETPVRFVDVILAEGSGAGSLYVPEKVNAQKGMMESDSGFEAVSVSGREAVIESQSFMPLVLAVNAGDNITLTLESSSLERDEMIKTAEAILSSWKATESD